jgi:hypothetical protein
MGKYNETVKNGWLDDVTSSILYLALYVGDPEGAGTEISGGDYARKSVATTDWAAAASSAIANVNAVTFPAATGVWSAADITYWALFDAATDGNLIASDDLAAGQQQPVVDGNIVEFPIGDIDLTITDPT